MYTEGSQGIIITQTPFRISFFGGGTDFPGYFNECKGAVLGVTIDKFMYVTINSLKRLNEKRIRLSYSKLEVVDDPADLQHQIVKHILLEHRLYNIKDFLDIHSYADLPASSGVGSSSAFAVGMLNALYLLKGIYQTPRAIAKEAIVIERDKMGDYGGWQDQIFAAYGGFNRIVFNQNDFIVDPVTISIIKKRWLEEACLLFFTGDLRSSSQVQCNVMNNQGDEKKGLLNNMYNMVQEGFDILYNSKTKEEMIYEFGKLLHKAWIMKKSLSVHVSNEKIDQLYEKGIQAGALGGKLCGAGSGGFVLFIVPEDKRDNVIQSLKQYKKIDIRFHHFGSRVIYSSIVG